MLTEAFWYQLADRLKQIVPIFFMVLLAIETIWSLYAFKKMYTKETWVNITTGTLSFVLQALIKGSLITNLHPEIYKHRWFDLGLTWQAWLIGFIIYGLLQYAIHYVSHKVRFFWCLHEVHHSAVNMNVTTGLRTSVFDVISLEMSYIVMPLIGCHPIIYFMFYIVNKLWGTFIHISDNIIKHIPIIDKILVSPAAHHIHHACNIPYLDKNYGELVPWYDKLFGTYATEKEPLRYGTLSVQQEIGFWESQTHEFKKLFNDIKQEKKWANKLQYLFRPPGWHPNNNSATTKVMQQALNLEL